MNKTYVAKRSDIKREWLVVDADGQNLGRLASKVAEAREVFLAGLLVANDSALAGGEPRAGGAGFAATNRFIVLSSHTFAFPSSIE